MFAMAVNGSDNSLTDSQVPFIFLEGSSVLNATAVTMHF